MTAHPEQLPLLLGLAAAQKAEEQGVDAVAEDKRGTDECECEDEMLFRQSGPPGGLWGWVEVGGSSLPGWLQPAENLPGLCGLLLIRMHEAGMAMPEVAAETHVGMADNSGMTMQSGKHSGLEYHLVDVFTNTVLAGNPLAVVMDTVGLSTERMLAIAREFNLSETTFVQRRDAAEEERSGVRVRIFTTEEELPFAGHPTLGTASVLRMTDPGTMRDGCIRLALNVGTVPVEFRGEELYGEMTQRDPELGRRLDGAEVARLTGLAVEDLDAGYAPQVVSTGTAFAIVLLRSVEGLARLKVRHDEATPWLREMGARWFYVLAPESGRKDTFRARMQFHGAEDAATGSAAGCAISYLVAHGAVAAETLIRLQQGVEMGRPSELMVRAGLESGNVVRVRVAGNTVPVGRGELML